MWGKFIVLLRHTVKTTQVAVISKGYPQVIMNAVKRINKHV
jgi:hypothetical protein